MVKPSYELSISYYGDLAAFKENHLCSTQKPGFRRDPSGRQLQNQYKKLKMPTFIKRWSGSDSTWLLFFSSSQSSTPSSEVPAKAEPDDQDCVGDSSTQPSRRSSPPTDRASLGFSPVSVHQSSRPVWAQMRKSHSSSLSSLGETTAAERMDCKVHKSGSRRENPQVSSGSLKDSPCPLPKKVFSEVSISISMMSHLFKWLYWNRESHLENIS